MQPYRSLWEGEFAYSIFCYYLYQIVDRYEPWIETVLKVIQLKCAQQLAEEAEQH